MIIYVDVITGREIASDSYKESKVKVDGKSVKFVKGLVSKHIALGGESFDTGANASAEGGAEAGGDDGIVKVINIVHTHQLMSVSLDKKEAKAFFKTYWKAGMKALQQKYFDALGIEEIPSDPAEAKAAVAAALEELDEDEVEAAEAMKKLPKKFKKNHAKIKAFVKESIMGNFDEYEFYIPTGSELGNCAIIPARYEGSSATPTFFFFMDLIQQNKE